MARRSKLFTPITQCLPQSPTSEAYRLLRANLDFARIHQKKKVLLITSTAKGEGKTSTATNIATIYAQSNKKVLLIDADLRSPKCHVQFFLSNTMGLSNYLSQQCTFEDAIQQSSSTGLDLISAGSIPPNPAELLTSEDFALLIQTVREMYDIVIVDTPPVLPFADAMIVSQQVDGIVFVVDTQKSNRFAAERALSSLAKSPNPILGIVLNRMSKREQSYSYAAYQQ